MDVNFVFFLRQHLRLLLMWLRACSKGGNTDRALTLLQVVKDKKLPIDSYCYTAVIDGE